MTKTIFSIALGLNLNAALYEPGVQSITQSRTETQYAVSLNMPGLETYSAWKIQGSNIMQLFSTADHKALQRDLHLSPMENSAMQNYARANYGGSASFKSTANRSVEQVWGIGDTHALIQTNDDKCDAFSPINCLGYYEPVLINKYGIKNTGKYQTN